MSKHDFFFLYFKINLYNNLRLEQIAIKTDSLDSDIIIKEDLNE